MLMQAGTRNKRCRQARPLPEVGRLEERERRGCGNAHRVEWGAVVQELDHPSPPLRTGRARFQASGSPFTYFLKILYPGVFPYGVDDDRIGRGPAFSCCELPSIAARKLFLSPHLSSFVCGGSQMVLLWFHNIHIAFCSAV